MDSIKQIIEDVEEYFGLDEGSLVKYNKQRTTAKARKLAMHLSREYTDYSLSEIGNVFNRDFSTVYGNLKDVSKIEQEIKYFNKRYKTKWWTLNA